MPASEIPPRLVVVAEVDAPRHLQIGRGVRLHVRLPFPPSISQPRESIPRMQVRVLKVFPSRLSSYPRHMGSAAWPHTVDPTTRPPAICPRAAILAENCPGEEGIAIFEEVVRCLFRRCYCGDVLVGDLAQNLGYEGHLCFGCAAIVRMRILWEKLLHVNSPACVSVPEAPDAFGPAAG